MRLEKNNIILEVFLVGELQVNCTLIYSTASRDAVFFDPGNDFDGIINAVGQKQLKTLALIHTHAHFDHIGQSFDLKKKLGAPLYLHQEDLPLYNSLPTQASMFGHNVSKAHGPIDHPFTETSPLQLEKENSDLAPVFKSCRILHTPGHTLGGCCFYFDYFDTPVLIAGDTIFFRSVGRTDLPGGSFEALLSSIKEKILPLPPATIIIPGHGQETTVGDENRYNPFIRTIRNKITPLV